MTDVRDLIAEALAAHVDHVEVSTRMGMTCSCGEWGRPVDSETYGLAVAEHRRHVTDTILAVLVGGTQHPEEHCHRCYRPNALVWSAPSPLWNAVMRGGSINGPWEYDEIICPTCFADLAAQRGIASFWRFSAERVNVELETVTPSGRVWDAEKWLWLDPPPGQAPGDESLTRQCELEVYATVRHPAWPRDFAYRTTAEAAQHTARIWGGDSFAASRLETEWPDGSVHTGPWQPVP